MGEGKVIRGECVEVAWNKTCKKLAFLGIAQEKECDEEYPGRWKKIKEAVEPQKAKDQKRFKK